jgi:hypothetical protein
MKLRWPSFLPLNPLGSIACAISLVLVNHPIALSQTSIEVNSRLSKTTDQTLPCLDSSKECVEKLAEAAIARSGELKTLDDQIRLLDRRLGLASEGIDYAQSKLWTNYIPDPSGGNLLNIINPISWIKNLFGGGDIQRERLAITDLEIKKADIEAARAELESLLQEQILTLALNYEAAVRQSSSIISQLDDHQILSKVVEIDYRFGGSSTDAYLAAVEKRERLENQLIQTQISQNESVRKILSLTGFTAPETNSVTIGRE